MPTPYISASRLLGEQEEWERKRTKAALDEWHRMRAAKRQPLPLKLTHFFVGFVLFSGAALTLIGWWLSGWHF